MRVWRRAVIVCLAIVAVLTGLHFPRDVDAIASANPWLERPDYARFYDVGSPAFEPRGEPNGPGAPSDEEPDSVEGAIRAFVRQYRLDKKRVLEVGAGTGELQDIVDQYTGLDISGTVRPFFHKPFVQASATQMPFASGTFDAIWTINVLEHVPKPEQALSEMRRVLKDEGLLYLQAAWQCRPWVAEGYHIRPYADLDVSEKLIKASIPLRDSVAYRSLYTFPVRLLRWAGSVVTDKPTAFRYRRLNPNYDYYWDSDSDAVNSMDPYEAILWFTSRGDEVLSFEGPVAPFFVRSGAIVLRINK